MMQVRTKIYNLTVPEFKRIIFTDYLQRMKWILALLTILFAITVIFAFDGNNPDLQPLMQSGRFLFLYLILIYVVVKPLRLIEISKNTLSFMSRYCEIDDNFFSVYYADGSYTKIKHEYLKRIVKCRQFYLFFYTKYQLFYLPLSALETEQDINDLSYIIDNRITN